MGCEAGRATHTRPCSTASDLTRDQPSAFLAQDGLEERDGRLVIGASGAVLTDAMVRDAIEGGRR